MTHADIDPQDAARWPRLEMALAPKALAHLARQIQYGGLLPVDASESRSVRDFMVQALGLDPDYVEGRVATVFLDGRAVDDLDEQRLRPGACLSLSAAMPGVAGIVMRRSSPFKRMRALELLKDENVFEDKERQEGVASGVVEIKLFNFIAVEGGPVLLARGLGLTARRLASVLGDTDFVSGVLRAEMDGAAMDPAALAGALVPILAAEPGAVLLVTAGGA